MIAEFIEMIGYSIEGFAGWRYLLSPGYRRRVHERWRQQSRLETAFEIFVALISFAFITLVFGALIWWLLFS
jgi:hypothetical protein